MDELIKACSDYRSGKYSSLQLWFNAYYTAIDNAKSVYGWDSVVDCINKNMGESFVKKNILNRYYISKKKKSERSANVASISKRANLKKESENDLKVDSHSIKIEYPAEFDDYPQLSKTTKIALSKNNLGISDFEKIGILNDYDQNSVSKKVRSYIAERKTAEKSDRELNRYQD